MAFVFFKIRVNGDETEGDRLNDFLNSHRILAVRNEWVADGEDSFWAFCVDYHATGGSGKGSSARAGNQRIDYKGVLPPEQFAVFARLRDVRKEIAQAAGIPVFTIFTNEQLAGMVKQECRTIADLKEIDGIGEARAGKYGEQVLAVLAEKNQNQTQQGDEK